jgi:hypothetical protein
MWPLFFVRLVFLILNFGALLFCLFLTCWPLVMALAKAWKDTGGGRDFQQYIQGMDWTSFFPDLHFILMTIVLGLLYITWWSLLAAMFDGAAYARMREYQKENNPYSLAEFFKDGVRYMFPMVGLQACWFLIFMAVFLGIILLVILLAVIGHLLSIPWWIGLLLGLPGGVAFVLLMLAFMTYGVMGGAYLVEGKGIFHSLKAAYEKTKQNYGRVIWAFLLLWVIYIVFTTAFQSVMNIFGTMRWIGFLFLLAEMAVSTVLSIAIWIYMPALAVAFSLEEED